MPPADIELALPMTPEMPSTGGWFTNGYPLADPDERQRLFLATLVAMLDRVRPHQVDPAETTLTNQGPSSLIAIIPHRGMAGLSIVARLDIDVIAVCWDQIGPYFDHDDDLMGFHVASFAEDADSFETRCQNAVECVRQQLDRPIEMQLTYAQRKTEPIRVEYRLAGEGSATVRVALVRTWFPWLYGRRRRETCIARFTDDHAPPFVKAAAAERWFD